jgi:hypothetical protein
MGINSTPPTNFSYLFRTVRSNRPTFYRDAFSEDHPQKFGTVGENPVRLDEEKATQSSDALNSDLTATDILYHSLRKHHWHVDGAEYEQLHDWFDAAEDAAVQAATGFVSHSGVYDSL